MNIFKTAYARIFEGCFRLVIPVLPYRDPKIYKKIDEIPTIITSEGLKKPIIITDKVIEKTGLLEHVANALQNGKLEFTVYDGVLPNPTTDMVEDVRKIYLDNGNDSIIAIGGGSVMDCAKALGARIVRPKKSLTKMKGILKVRHKLPYLIAVPTTAGTGSETTLAAVIVDSKTRHKFVINDFPLIPRATILDPITTKTLPPHIASTTGVDALTHAIEAFIGRSTTKSTRSDAMEATRIIFENLLSVYKMPNDENREKMLLASHLAGRAFTKSYVGYVHALAHALGGKYNTPHGLANAILLPYVLDAYGSKIDKKLKKLAVYCQFCDEDTPNEEAKRIFMEKLKDLLYNLSIPSYVADLKEEDFDELVGYAYKEAYPLYPVPVLWTKDQLKEIYKKVLKK